MIKIAPGTEIWPLLVDIVNYPGEMDVSSLTTKHYPFKAGVLRTPAEWRQNRAAREAHSHHFHTRVSRYLGRLSEARLIEKENKVRLDPVFARFWEQKGIEALRNLRPVVDDRGEIVGNVIEQIHPTAILIAELVAQGPITFASLSRQTGGRSAAGNTQGAWVFQYEKLIREGVLCPPRYRWPTPEGSALVRA